jgi:hypothetical protein
MVELFLSDLDTFQAIQLGQKMDVLIRSWIILLIVFNSRFAL